MTPLLGLQFGLCPQAIRLPVIAIGAQEVHPDPEPLHLAVRSLKPFPMMA